MFAGIDWGGHRHQLAVVDAGGVVVVNRAFAHDRAGVEELLAELASHGTDPVPVAIECSGAWWWRPSSAMATPCIRSAPGRRLGPESATRPPFGKTTASTPSCWPTRCG